MRAHVRLAAASMLVFSTSLLTPMSVLAADPEVMVYTTSADFAKGTMDGVNDDIPDQLQLDSNSSTFPFIWVANSGEGTVSKLDTVTGEELGRYRSAPDRTGANPSRTTVDLDGNVWVGNRDSNTITKIGLLEAGNCVDRNGNGTIETSSGAADVKGWPAGSDAADECILAHVVLGSASGSNNWVRALAVDADNNIFAGMSAGPNVYHVDGETGDVIQTFTQPFGGAYPSYGAVVDRDGSLWVAAAGNYAVVKHTFNGDGTHAAHQTVSLPGYGYGMALDAEGYLWVSGWTNNNISKVRTSDGSVEATYSLGGHGVNGLRGVAVTDDGDLWIAASFTNNVIRIRPDGSKVAVIPVGAHPTGVAVDDAGKVWVTNHDSHNVSRIDPDTNTVDATFAVGRNPYNYSDMTGAVVRNITVKQGTWTFYDGDGNTPWSSISWNSYEPPGTEIKVHVKAAENDAGLDSAPWVEVEKGKPLPPSCGSCTRGKHIVRATLTVRAGETPPDSPPDISPVLYDLTVTKERLSQCTDTSPALTWLTDETVPAAGTLDVGFTWAQCEEPVRDETVAVRVRNAATNSLISGFVYGEQITFDEASGEYHLDFYPDLYHLPPGTRLKVMVYFGNKLKGTTYVDVTE